MKKASKKKALVLAVLLVFVLATAAFAAEGKTVEVKGYGFDDAEISISNVIEATDGQDIDTLLDGYFVVQAPAVVTILQEGGVIFDVSKVNKVGDKYEVTEETLPISGQAEAMGPDPSGALDDYGYPQMIIGTVDANVATEYDDLPNYLPGCNVTLTEPGYYYACFRYGAIADSCDVLIKVADTAEGAVPSTPTAPKTDAPAPTAQAAPTAAKVMVNGTATSFDAYNINNNNYFKLRDLAKVLSGSEKQFEVKWDVDKKAINLISNTAYTEIGGEMAAGDGKAKKASLNQAKIYKDGVEIPLTAYNINDNNYFKLRDIAKAFNIGVTWDSATQTIGIDTSIDYVEE
ncbi:MAG: stalk domain-containing protein [Bacillota bacterium]